MHSVLAMGLLVLSFLVSIMAAGPSFWNHDTNDKNCTPSESLSFSFLWAPLSSPRDVVYPRPVLTLRRNSHARPLLTLNPPPVQACTPGATEHVQYSSTFGRKKVRGPAKLTITSASTPSPPHNSSHTNHHPSKY